MKPQITSFFQHFIYVVVLSTFLMLASTYCHWVWACGNDTGLQIVCNNAQINAAQEATLLSIANSKSNAAYKAQALLYRAQGTEFDVLLPELPNAIGSGGHTVFKTHANTAILTLVQPFVPNPVAQLAILAYNLTSESEATLYITDISGKIIRQATLKGSGNYSLNTQTISNGLYLYTVVQDGNVLLRDKLIILK